jgi:hypothetical protein
MNGEIKVSSGVCGRYRLVAHKADAAGQPIEGTERVVADWFCNLITDTGLDLIGSSASWLNSCRVGSGTTAPAASDTDLVSYTGTNSSIQSSVSAAQSTPPYYISKTLTYRFNAGLASGNLSEIGVFTTSGAGGIMFSRALILDSGGSPTTITIQEDEILDALYEFRIYPPTDDQTGSINLGGVEYAWIGRASLVTSSGVAGWTTGVAATSPNPTYSAAYNGVLGAITVDPSGSTGSVSSAVGAAYVPGSYEASATYTWGVTVGNVSGGISAVKFKLGMGAWKFGFTPSIPKDSSHTLILSMKHTWARKDL